MSAFWKDGFWANGFWKDGFWDGMGSGTVSVKPWTRQRRPIRRYTDWSKWNQVAQDQITLKNELDLQARVASDRVDDLGPDTPEGRLVAFQAHLKWIDIEFARRADQLGKAESQVDEVRSVLQGYKRAVTVEPAPSPPPTAEELRAKFMDGS